MKQSHHDYQPPSSPLGPSHRTTNNINARPPSRNSSYNTAGSNNGPSSPQRSTKAPKLHLPSLPRFHPANYPSSNPGDAASLSAPHQHPQGSLSPGGSGGGGHTRKTSSQNLSEAQRQLYIYHREIVSLSRANNPKSPNSLKSANSSPRVDPGSPRLKPLGSPGPITPLELEDEKDDYFAATTTTAAAGGKNDGKDGREHGSPQPTPTRGTNRRAESRTR